MQGETRLLKVQTSSHSKSVMGAHGECNGSLSLGFDDQNTDGNKGPGGVFDSGQQICGDMVSEVVS